MKKEKKTFILISIILFILINLFLTIKFWNVIPFEDLFCMSVIINLVLIFFVILVYVMLASVNVANLKEKIIKERENYEDLLYGYKFFNDAYQIEIKEFQDEIKQIKVCLKKYNLEITKKRPIKIEPIKRDDKQESKK